MTGEDRGTVVISRRLVRRLIADLDLLAALATPTHRRQERDVVWIGWRGRDLAWLEGIFARGGQVARRLRQEAP